MTSKVLLRCSQRGTHALVALLGLFFLAATVACDGDDGTPQGTNGAATDVLSPPAEGDAVFPPGPGEDARDPDPPPPTGEDVETGEPSPTEDVQDEPAPAGPPMPPTYEGGQCPPLAAGEVMLVANGIARRVFLYLPDNPEGAGVTFVWHGNGDTPLNIARAFKAADMARDRDMIVVVPFDCCADGAQACCNQMSTWGFLPTAPANAAADLAVFDNALSCLKETFDVDLHRVYTTGFSAGALWSSYLVMHRADVLAAAAIFSGGCGQYNTCREPARRIPTLLVSGGANDTYMGMVDFELMTGNLAELLVDSDHTVVRCGHTLGHRPPAGFADWGFEFLLAHEWDTDPSPFTTTGLSASFPGYCELL